MPDFLRLTSSSLFYGEGEILMKSMHSYSSVVKILESPILVLTLGLVAGMDSFSLCCVLAIPNS